MHQEIKETDSIKFVNIDRNLRNDDRALDMRSDLRRSDHSRAVRRAEPSTIDTFEIPFLRLELLVDCFAKNLVDELIGVRWMSGIEM